MLLLERREDLMIKPDTRTDALLGDLLQGGAFPDEILGEHGLLKSLMKRLVERALADGLTTHLGYERPLAPCQPAIDLLHVRTGESPAPDA